MKVEDSNNTYYSKGNVEPAKATRVTTQRLEKRRQLTRTSQRLVLVLVGLPGRGKSFIGRKLEGYLRWRGADCKMFNVGRYRRQAHAAMMGRTRSNSIDNGGPIENEGPREKTGSCTADFFDPNNEMAANLRAEVAKAAMDDMLEWLVTVGDEGKYLHDQHIGIFDATNSTKARRQWILEECAAHRGKPGVIFVESICDDQELLDENFRYKISSSPDFKGMSEEDSLKDLRNRVKKYEDHYETMDNNALSYIKIYNLSSRLLANQIYGKMSKAVIPALMAWNVGTRPIWLCRAGQTNNRGSRQCTSATLGPKGIEFQHALRKFVNESGSEYMRERSSCAPSLNTGTSITGLSSSQKGSGDDVFPCKVMCSTMPRAIETVMWKNMPYRVDVLSNLNPMDKGDFAGMELEHIKKEEADWYSQLKKDPYNTRFPGGECYRDLVCRLESSLIDMEQQVAPVLVASHVSVIQVLLSYFRNSPIEKCGLIDVPLHTVIKLLPDRGGGWIESRHSLLSEDSNSDASDTECPTRRLSHPVWCDQDAVDV